MRSSSRKSYSESHTPPLQGLSPCRSFPRLLSPSSQPPCRPSRCRAPRSRLHRRTGAGAACGIGGCERALPPQPMARRPAEAIPADTVGSAVTVVTGEELRAQQVRTAVDALRSLPGVAVSRSGGIGNFTQVRIRGAEGNHTLVLVDGIEANNIADGEFDFSNLSAEDIERIEVIRGPMSGLYGSNAVGGVINIITRRGKGPLTVTVRSEGGSFGTRDMAVRAAGGNDNAHLAVSYHWRDTDGFNISPSGRRERRLAPRHADGARRGQAAAGRHPRFHRAPHREDRRPRRLRRHLRPGACGHPGDGLRRSLDARQPRAAWREPICAGTRRTEGSRRRSAPTTTAR